MTEGERKQRPEKPDAGKLQDPATFVSGRTPPHDLDAEGSVLSSVLLSERDLDRVIGSGLEPQHFYSDANRRIYESILRLHDSGMAIDLIEVAGDLRLNQRLDQVGGTPYLALLTDQYPTVLPRLLEQHTSRIIATYRGRLAIASMQLGIAELYTPGGKPLDQTIERVESEIWEIANTSRSRTYERASDIAKRTLNTLSEALKSDSRLLGATTGFSELDKRLTGLHAGDLTVVAARPGIGKTAFALSMILRLTEPRVGKPKQACYFHSCEMPREQIVLRLLCAMARVELVRLRLGQVSSADWEKLYQAAEVLGSREIYIDDKPAVSVVELRNNIRRIKREIESRSADSDDPAELVLAAVDYLQLMTGDKSQNREREVSSLSQGLKNLAKLELLAVLALAQINREAEKRSGVKGKRPQLSDLRESGAIENDADNVLMLYRDKYYNDDANDDAEVIIAKQRNGPPGTVLLHYHGPSMTFRPLAIGQEVTDQFDDFGDAPDPHWNDL